jgi:hypothetical protein
LRDKELIDIFWQSSRTENLYTEHSMTIATGRDLVTTIEILFPELDRGYPPAKRAYDGVISTLLTYIEENGIIVPIVGKGKTYYGTVMGKVDGGDKYTVKYIGFPDEKYLGADIWGAIAEKVDTVDLEVPIDDFFKSLHGIYMKDAAFNRD